VGLRKTRRWRVFLCQAASRSGKTLPGFIGTKIAFKDLRALVSDFRRKLVINSSSIQMATLLFTGEVHVRD
jgi:hypothetical protein